MGELFSGASTKTGSTQPRGRGSGVIAAEGKPNKEEKQQEQPAESPNTGEQNVDTFPNSG